MDFQNFNYQNEDVRCTKDVCICTEYFRRFLRERLFTILIKKGNRRNYELLALMKFSLHVKLSLLLDHLNFFNHPCLPKEYVHTFRKTLHFHINFC